MCAGLHVQQSGELSSPPYCFHNLISKRGCWEITASAAAAYTVYLRHRRGLHIHTQTHIYIYTRTDAQSRGDLRVHTRWALNLRFVIKLLLERFNHRDLILRGSTSLERKRTQSCRCPLNIHTCTQSISANVKRLRRTQME